MSHDLVKSYEVKGFLSSPQGEKQTTHIRKYYVFDFPSCFLLRRPPHGNRGAKHAQTHAKAHMPRGTVLPRAEAQKTDGLVYMLRANISPQIPCLPASALNSHGGSV